MKSLLFYSLLLFSFFHPTSSKGQTIDPTKLNSALAALTKPDEPGFSVAIVQNSKVRYAQAFGMSDIVLKKRNTVGTPFNIASMSKQFTAACIYLLEREGKLATSDKLSKYFPDLPSYADSITITDLIHHQNGLRDYITLFWLRDMTEDSAYGPSSTYQILAKQKSLNFSPGTSFSYTNTGYYFLSEIVRKVSGQDLQVYAQQNIFNPLKMKHTSFSRTHAVKNKANGYYHNGEQFIIHNQLDSTIGQGNAYSIVADWKYWLQEMKNHKLLGAQVWRKMTSPASTIDEKPTGYGGGLLIHDFQGRSTIDHGGDLSAYHSKMTYFPKEDLGIVVFSNNSEIGGSMLTESIYNQLFKTKDSSATSKNVSFVKDTIRNITLDTSRYTGFYRIKDSEAFTLEVKVAEHKLTVNQLWNASEYAIVPDNDSLFHIDGNKDIGFEFIHFKDGKSDEVIIHQNNQHTAAKRMTIIPSIATNIDAYLGVFYNPEIDAVYEVMNDKGSLKLKIAKSELRLSSTGQKDKYNIPENGMQVTFTRSGDDRIDGLKLNHIRVKDLLFSRRSTRQ
ncbi:serine hydrolase [Pedobacter sp. BAL39]|uniref:serine hydrolase domain-containing protein n=1 Tax=Pedobacter sp. BAL39 TaxID=391596 RepID=UPI000315DD0F|nr:serine hydrolase domain-containing protein [Pedobacter sp. BAL39]